MVGAENEKATELIYAEVLSSNDKIKIKNSSIKMKLAISKNQSYQLLILSPRFLSLLLRKSAYIYSVAFSFSASTTKRFRGIFRRGLKAARELEDGSRR